MTPANDKNAMTYDELIQQAEKHYNEHEYQQAVDYAAQAIDLDAARPDGYYWRGIAYLAKGITTHLEEKERGKDYGSAITDFNTAINFGMKDTAVYINRGIAYLWKDNYDDAITDFENAIEIEPTNSEASHRAAISLYIRGSKYCENKEYISAIIDYARAVELYPQAGFLIDGFLNVIENNGKEIRVEIKNKLQGQQSGLVNLVGDILDTINEWDDCLNYIHLTREVYNLLERLEKEKEIEVVDLKKCCYQYVKRDSFIKNIGKERTLWLTPACYQNDPDEGKYIFDFFGSQFQTEPLKKLFKELTEDEDTGSGTPIAFIRSFSECEDDLQMWNSSYADNGAGVSLGVPFCKLVKAVNCPGHRHQESIDEFTMLIKKTDEENQIFSVSLQNQSTKTEKNEVTGIPIGQLYFTRVLYLSPEKETEDHKKYENHLNAIKNALNKFTKEYLNVQDNVQHFKNFLPRIFLPIAHLIKSADYQHEKEWRLLYYTSIKKGKQYIKCEPLHIETKQILFDSNENKEEIWLGPNFGKHPELEKLKIQHLFEYDGIDDRVDIKISKKHFRG